VECRPVTRQLSTHPGVGPLTGAGLRVGDWNARTFWLRQADCQLRGGGALGGVKRRPTTTRPHQQTRQRSIVLPAGRSRAGDGAQRSAMAQPVLSPGHAAWAQDRQGGDGAEVGNQLYWMWRRGWDYEEMQKLGSHAGEPGHRHGVQ